MERQRYLQIGAIAVGAALAGFGLGFAVGKAVTKLSTAIPEASTRQVAHQAMDEGRGVMEELPTGMSAVGFSDQGNGFQIDRQLARGNFPDELRGLRQVRPELRGIPENCLSSQGHPYVSMVDVNLDARRGPHGKPRFIGAVRAKGAGNAAGAQQLVLPESQDPAELWRVLRGRSPSLKGSLGGLVAGKDAQRLIPPSTVSPTDPRIAGLVEGLASKAGTLLIEGAPEEVGEVIEQALRRLGRGPDALRLIREWEFHTSLVALPDSRYQRVVTGLPPQQGWVEQTWKGLVESIKRRAALDGTVLRAPGGG